MPNLSSIMSGELAKAHEQSRKDQAESNSQNQSVTDKKSASQKYCGLSNQGIVARD